MKESGRSALKRKAPAADADRLKKIARQGMNKSCFLSVKSIGSVTQPSLMQ